MTVCHPAEPPPATWPAGLLDHLADQMQLDPEWCTRGADACQWWPRELAQELRLTAGVPRRLVARLAVLRGVPAGAPLAAAIADANALPLLSAWQGEAATGTVGLVASAVIPAAAEVEWLRLAAHAALLQVSVAFAAAPLLLRRLGGELATSAHPTRGLRTRADAALHLGNDLYARWGRRRPPLSETQVQRVASEFRPVVADLAGRDGVLSGLLAPPATAAALGPGRAVVDLTARRPVLGSGVELALEISLPASCAGADAGALAATWNAAEAAGATGFHALGAWHAPSAATPPGSPASAPAGATLTHRLFLPALLCRERLFPLLLATTIARYHWAAARLAAR